MNALTIPRAVAGAEYTLLRLPLTLVERQVVARFLDEESHVRLGFEKALGGLDASVGRLLDDDDLTRRGSALARRAEVLTTAIALDEKAEARKQEAASTLSSARQEADRRRTQAEDKAQQEAVAVRERQQAEKRAAAEQAEAKARARTEAVARETAARVAAEEKELEARTSRVEERTQARTAKPKAQLQEAGALRADAQRDRKTADRLADLAEAERASRKSS